MEKRPAPTKFPFTSGTEMTLAEWGIIALLFVLMIIVGLFVMRIGCGGVPCQF